VTAFDELARGDIIWGTNPLSDKGRPLLILGAPQFPTHGTQLITVRISTKTYHEESLTLRDDDYESDPLGERSHVLPWSLATLNSAADVEWYMTSLVSDRTADIATRSIGYISS
jgi:hypothetical protein